MKTFNTAGTCRPNEHYMVDITERLEIIRKMVAKGDFFCINRGRQYGKTTTLEALADYLKNDYSVFSISFEGLDDAAFENSATVCAEFLKQIKRNPFILSDTPLTLAFLLICLRNSAHTVALFTKAASSSPSKLILNTL